MDDETLLLKALRRMLMEHHDVDLAATADDALSKLGTAAAGASAPYDVVLCDLQMPEVSGVQLFKEVGTRWPPMVEKFIFFSGGAFSEEAKAFVDEAKRPFMSKPFGAAQVLSMIDERLGTGS